jgi:D-alanyl-D-alanine carboxypeptidase (penicillin-binding protein 5/6)
MSDIARLNLVLATTVFAFAGIIFFQWPQPIDSYASPLASPYCADTSLTVEMQANAGFATDILTGEVIFSLHSQTQLPLASLTKLMTVYTAMMILAPEHEITISRDALTPEGDGLRVGEVWKAQDLADYTLLSSVNDGARALALAAAEKENMTYEGFIARMNDNAYRMKLVQTYFSNETGLDISESMGASYGSAEDVATLLTYMSVHTPRLLEATTLEGVTFTAVTGEARKAKNTSSLISSLGGAIGSKTGFTDIAGGNLAIIFEPMPGRPVAAVVLGSTREGRDDDMRVLAAASKKWMSRNILCGSNSI